VILSKKHFGLLVDFIVYSKIAKIDKHFTKWLLHSRFFLPGSVL